MKVVFAGSPEFSTHALKALVGSKHQVVAVYSQPDKPKGRGKKLTVTPVKAVAECLNIPVLTPKNFKEATDREKLASFDADVMIVIAYGLILPESVLNLFKYGCINLHASILPKYRGASPIQEALLKGDEESGVSVMQMDKGMDTGEVLAIAKCPIDKMDNALMLHDKLAAVGIPSLLSLLDDLDEGKSVPSKKQDDAKASYCQKIQKQDALISWLDDATTNINKIRAYNPWPMAYFSWQDKTIRVLQATKMDLESDHQPGEILAYDKDGLVIACAKDAIKITMLQLPGKKAIEIKDCVNGNANLFSINQVLS